MKKTSYKCHSCFTRVFHHITEKFVGTLEVRDCLSDFFTRHFYQLRLTPQMDVKDPPKASLYTKTPHSPLFEYFFLSHFLCEAPCCQHNCKLFSFQIQT